MNQIAKQIGLDQNLSMTTPIVNQMETLSIIKYTLDNILFTIVFFLCLLSFILIYSLMQSVSHYIVLNITGCGRKDL